jgi:uncharacterized protein (TIGR02284 family)
MNDPELITVLNDLIETCTDAQEQFRLAAEHTCNSEFRRLFNIFSQQRAQFVSELLTELHRLEGARRQESREHQEHLRGEAARITHGDESAVIAACQRQEKAAINRYQEALGRDLPLDVQYVVKRQYMDIRDAYDRMRILQRAA